jgi:uncharacterized protein
MIRKLKESDRQISLNFLSEEPAINLFIIGDIENNGFDEDFQELWDSFNENNDLVGILLRYHESFVPYFNDKNFNVEEFKKIINSFPGCKIISGKESIVDNFIDTLKDPKVKYMNFCELKSNEKLSADKNNVFIATEKDAKEVYDLLLSIDEFDTVSTNSPERISENIRSKTSRIYYSKNEKDEICAVTQSTAECTKAAMIVGVACKKEDRKKGHVTKCLSSLCDDLLKEGKSLCLFYDNPKAGNIYHRLGFENIDRWTMAVEKESVEV